MAGGPKSPLPYFEHVEKLFGSAHDQGFFLDAKPFLIAGVMAVIAFLFISPTQSLRNFELLVLTSPLWLTVTLVYWACIRFVEANRVAWLAKQEYVLLELRIPRDIKKSPFAMETVLTNLNVSQGESTWYKRWINGSVRPSWTFEIVSLGGVVHFYVRTRVSYRRPVESFFYAQYPGIEITEAIDYSLLVDPAHAPYGMWGCDFKKRQPDPMPIRSYAEFLDPSSPLPKPDETIDPLAQVIELLGSIGPREQFWLQINTRITGGEKYNGRLNKAGKLYTWKDEAQEIIGSIRDGAVRKQKKVNKEGALIEEEGFGPLTKGMQEDIYAIEKNVNKPAFDVGIRAIYLAPDDAFQGSMITFLINIFKPFANENGNSLGITRWLAVFNDFPWEDPGGHIKEHLKHQLVDAYRRRAYFHEPYKVMWAVMSSEELATIFHIPSASVTAPSLPRIQSSTSEAPSNLPTG